LQISSVSPEEKASVQLNAALAASSGMGSMRPLTRVLNLEKWKRADLQDFIKMRQTLQRAIAFAKGDKEKEKTRRELMQFYFTNGFEAEALGVMDVMSSARPDILKEPEFLMLRGAASWLMGRLADARADLYNPILDGTDEATFWRAAVLAKEGHMADAAYDLRRTGAITQPYPKAVKMPTATLVADAAVELGDVKQATQYLDVLGIDDPSAAQKNQIDYVSGKLKELSGDPDGAIADWERVMEGVHRPSRAKAAVARTELLLKQGHYTPKDAIEQFEKLRFVWRGGDFEFNLLRRLGNLYLDQQMYRQGLNTLRQAVTNFPEHDGANEITKAMSDTFQNLYLHDGADVLAPVTAIALYDEFRELTPPGALGDEMIRKLADRMVGVDLLDRAADLLEQQVDFRLVGEEKARVGARLALIYVFDRKFDYALKALDKSDISKIPDDLKLKRLLLRARADVGLDKTQEALDLIRPEIGLQAEGIRAGIYWRAGDWKNASKSLGKIVRDLGIKPRKPLDDKQALAVLSLAVAYTLEGNDAGVSRTVVNFGEAMANSAYADAYKLISATPSPDMVDFRALDVISKKVDDFQGFMEADRKRASEGQLSSLY
jgi:tetratricopeptide (TPR) repeat protein